MWFWPLCLALSFTALTACTEEPAITTEPKGELVTDVTAPTPAPLMRWNDLLARPLPNTPHNIRIGEGNTDIVDLWLPDGDGPHPVVIMIHGGCWQKGIADRTLMNYAAEDLRTRGLAVWNIEYRGVDEAGGGYPGTFQDVAKAADALRDHAKTYNLITGKIAAIGHSAGGHLAAWLSTRANLPEDSPLYTPNPLPLYAVVNSGGLADLEASAPVTFDGCLANIMGTLIGTPSRNRPNVFSDTSPVELFPTTAQQISVNGDQDNIAPPILGEGYTEKALAAGMEAKFVLTAPSGHVELVAPQTKAFETQAEILTELFLTRQ